MSLDCNYKKIPNYETVCYLPGEKEGTFRISPCTFVISHMMMLMGLDGKITEKNLDEAILQFMTYQALEGRLLVRHRPDGTAEDVYISPADIRAHVGLETNAFGKNNTKAAFWRRYGTENKRRGLVLADKLKDQPAQHIGVTQLMTEG